MNPQDRELLGVYALDAIDDPAEVARVEALLRESADARAELARLREVAALLTPTDDVASTEVWTGIREAIDAPVPPLDLRAFRDRRRTRVQRLVAAAAAAAVIVAVAAGVVVGQRTSSEPTPDLVAAADEAADRDDAARIELASEDGDELAEVVYLPDGTGYVRSEALEDLPAGRVYQLWALLGSAENPEVISAGVLGRDPEVAAFHFSGPIVGFALTIENDPGVVSSNEPPTAVGLLG